MSETATNFYAVCSYYQHVLAVLPGTELEKKCQDREREHPEQIGAIVVQSDNCPECYGRKQKDYRYYLDAVRDWDMCPAHQQHGYLCKVDCENHLGYPGAPAPNEGPFLWDTQYIPED